LNHALTAEAVHAERKVSKAFGGSCQIPLAAYAQPSDGQVRFRAMIASVDGQHIARADLTAPAGQTDKLSQEVIAILKQQNAEEILALCRSQDA
jgi:hydroxymethylbilane synthase